jgi:hypothetical protein
MVKGSAGAGRTHRHGDTACQAEVALRENGRDERCLVSDASPLALDYDAGETRVHWESEHATANRGQIAVRCDRTKAVQELLCCFEGSVLRPFEPVKAPQISDPGSV